MMFFELFGAVASIFGLYGVVFYPRISRLGCLRKPVGLFVLSSFRTMLLSGPFWGL